MLRFLVLLAIIWLVLHLIERGFRHLAPSPERPTVGRGRPAGQASPRSASVDRLVVCEQCQVRVPASLATPRQSRWVCDQCAQEPPAARREA